MQRRESASIFSLESLSNERSSYKVTIVYAAKSLRFSLKLKVYN